MTTSGATQETAQPLTRADSRTRVVWKFPMPVGFGEVAVDMPVGAEILSVGQQDVGPRIWALCDPEAPREPRLLLVLPTGDRTDMSRAGRFVGTIHGLDGWIWLHVWEIAA